MTKTGLILVVAVIAVVLLPRDAATQTTKASQAVGQQRPGIDSAAIEGRLREALKQDAKQAATEAAAPVLEAARRDQELGKLVLDVMKNWIAVVSLLVTLFFAILGFIGWKEYGAVRRARDETTTASNEAKHAAGRAREMESEVNEATGRVKAMGAS